MPVIVIAPDSFKGTLSAREVANALARGLRAAELDILELPVGDGGEGTMDVLVAVLGGELRTAVVSDPLGRAVEAKYALLPHGETAIVETAQASGLWRVTERERNAWAASTHGTGELVAAAARAGASKVIVTVGGSATTDGGIGAIEALDQAGIDVELHVLCDVRSTWEEAPRLYGPQKGADPTMVARLERRLDEVAQKAPRDPRGVLHTGSAGGLSGGLWAFRGACLFPGAAYVLDALGFDEHLREATFVVTGEGRLDTQTLQGKAVAEVALRCRKAGVACHAVVGQNTLDANGIAELALASVREATTAAELERAGHDLAA
jgi:glycerate 2-kinase